VYIVTGVEAETVVVYDDTVFIYKDITEPDSEDIAAIRKALGH
jgi:hypothetical protein